MPEIISGIDIACRVHDALPSTLRNEEIAGHIDFIRGITPSMCVCVCVAVRNISTYMLHSLSV